MSNSLYRDLYVTRTDLIRPLAKSILLSIDSALAIQQLKNLETDPLALVSASLEPKGYSCAEKFRRDYLATEMFSKYPYWDLKIDRKAVAISKFLASEAQCLETNRRLLSPRTWSFETTSVIHTASRKISELLGPFSWDEAAVGFDFGPGGTTRLRRKHADRYFKFSGIPETTISNLPLADACLRYFSSWGREVEGQGGPSLKVVPGNKIITVPKNAKTDRVIAVEPCMNIFVQKGIGDMIRRRLRRKNVDLNDQRPNQVLAKAGSIDGSLSTLDLSSASDTVSYEIVRQLLPYDWFDALCACRTDRGVLPSGEIIYYRKFSSMGNGFTFELESLIFWAICSAVRSLSTETDRRMAVYGDDIIVPVGITPAVVRCLEFAGFTVNPKKSHVDGPFRESCGKHYFLGSDVTPIYVKDHVNSYPRYIWLANQLKRWSANETWGCDPLLKPAYDLVRGNIKGFWAHPMICDGMGDGALIGDFDEVLPGKAPRQWCGWRTKFFVEQRSSFLPDDKPILLKSLFRLEKSMVVEDEGVRIPLDVPLEKTRYAVSAKRTVWQWNDLGPWLA